jgi:hypothetical protein
VPNFTACTKGNKLAAAKILCTILLKMQNDVNMNAAFIDTLLSLIPMAFKLNYKQVRMMDPNAVFQQCDDWFVIKYGCTLAEDHKINWMAMAADWHPSMGFEVLTSCLFRQVTFACFSGHLFTDKDTVDIGVVDPPCPWQQHQQHKQLCLLQNFLGECRPDCCIYRRPCQPARNGIATTNNNVLAHLLMDALLTFGTA